MASKMGRKDFILLWNLMAAMIILGHARPNIKGHLQMANNGLKTDCIGNLMRLSLDKGLAEENQLEVEAINGTQHILLTPSLAAQCGYSMESDPWGNTRIYTSLMGCYTNNKDDVTFKVDLRLKIYSQGQTKIASHDVSQTCTYAQWASKEILCDRNYMEVSHYIGSPEVQTDVKGQLSDASTIPGPSRPEHGIWKMTFYTPEPVVMVQREAEQAGYSAMNTSNRLVVRSPYNTAETYSEDVAGVPMEILRVSTYYKSAQGLTIMNLAAACPTDGVLFTEDLISWHIPRRVMPLIDGKIKMIETHMGINGQRLDKSQMAMRGYTLSATEFHIVIEIPVGSPDGYNKSHAPDYQYHTSYTIEPMLEMLWREENTQEDTRYKVLFPITTPLMLQPLKDTDYTSIEDKIFRTHLGTFLHDVVLKNITFSTGVLDLEEINARGFLIQEHLSPGGTKSFSLEVPFDTEEVLKHNPELLVTTYTLPLVFGFIILPEESTFSHAMELQMSLQDVVLPAITGTCDDTYFYISVRYGSQGKNFQTMVGAQQLTPELAQAYRFRGNDTHFSLVVSHIAEDVTYELITSDSVRARLDLMLLDPNNHWLLADLYLSCNFHLTTTTCYPNGTVTAVAVKVASVPNLVPSWLTLNDKSCTPDFSDSRFASFAFSVDSCGTTRTFNENYMVYKNEISMSYDKGRSYTSPVDPAYRQTIYCVYMVNDTQSVGFSYKPRSTEPAAEIGSGLLVVQMQLAQDSSYELFYQAEDYPVVKFLQQPLYFEVALMQTSDPHLELVLENCWATLNEDRASLPSWDLIIDKCENPDDSYVTVFHPVVANARINVPSHVKHFSVKMFTFTKGEDVLKDEIYVHCDVVICDPDSQATGACSGQCIRPSGLSDQKYRGMKGTKRQRRNPDLSQQRHISSGPIILLKPE